MNHLKKILPVCVPLTILNAACVPLEQSGNLARIAWMLLRDAGVLLAVFSFILYGKEVRRGAKFVFLNYALFFSYMGILNPTVEMMMNWLHLTDEWSGFYFSQYASLSYFFLLPFSVIYLAIDFAFRRSRVYQKYLVTMSVVGSCWVFLFYPYLGNPKYLYTTKEVQEYRAIRDAMHDQEKNGISEPTVRQIAGVVKFHSPEGRNVEMTSGDREATVAEILPYLRGDNHVPLVWRPMYWACTAMSALCVIFILCLILYQYLADPPEGAYVEKIVWSVLLFCGFEVLHNYAFAKTRTYETLAELQTIGGYITLATMIALLFLFVVRLRFVQSVEGNYYERQLASDASHITRWRDAFDNWVLCQFMNPQELHGRFLVHLTRGMAQHTFDKESQ